MFEQGGDPEYSGVLVKFSHILADSFSLELHMCPQLLTGISDNGSCQTCKAGT